MPLDINEGAQGDDLLAVEIPDELFVQYEWVEEGKGYRESLIRAELVNRYPVVAATEETSCAAELLEAPLAASARPAVRAEALRVCGGPVPALAVSALVEVCQSAAVPPHPPSLARRRELQGSSVLASPDAVALVVPTTGEDEAAISAESCEGLLTHQVHNLIVQGALTAREPEADSPSQSVGENRRKASYVIGRHYPSAEPSCVDSVNRPADPIDLLATPTRHRSFEQNAPVEPELDLAPTLIT
jgi:hypothetical protein